MERDTANIVERAAETLLHRLEEVSASTADYSVADRAEALVDAAVVECLEMLESTGLWGEANREPSQRFWQIAGPIIQSGSLLHHARLKPRGYAGDFEMLSKIWDRYECEHPLGRLLDRFYQRQAAPAAVRSRTRLLAWRLADAADRHRGDGFRVVSIGSGPAIDIANGLSLIETAQRELVKVTLVDVDPHALEAAQDRLLGLLRADQIDCVRANLFRLPQQGGTGNKLRACDFLLCSGMFDYLEEADAISMLAFLNDRLSRGGQLWIGNFAAGNPTRSYMEWVGNWYLIYRTPDDLLRLAKAAGISQGRVKATREPLGINLFLTVTK